MLRILPALAFSFKDLFSQDLRNALLVWFWFLALG